MLHRVRWLKGEKFISIADCYIKYMKKHYGNSSEVIFDGYEDESINPISAELFFGFFHMVSVKKVRS